MLRCRKRNGEEIMRVLNEPEKFKEFSRNQEFQEALENWRLIETELAQKAEAATNDIWRIANNNKLQVWQFFKDEHEYQRFSKRFSDANSKKR